MSTPTTPRIPDAVNIVGPLLRVLHTRLAGAEATRERLVIGVAGESGSGKTTTAAALALGLTTHGIPAALVSQDNYFVRPPRTNHAHRVADLSSVGPHEVQLELMAEHIAAFRSGAEAITMPLVNYPANRFDEQRLELHHLRVLVVEGTYALHLTGLDVRIFLEATHAETHERRMARNRDAWEPIIDTILAIEHTHIAPQAQRADWLIDAAFRLREGPAHA